MYISELQKHLKTQLENSLPRSLSILKGLRLDVDRIFEDSSFIVSHTHHSRERPRHISSDKNTSDNNYFSEYLSV